MSIKCCHGCVPPKRHTACWDTCPDYAKEKAKHDAEREAERQRKQISGSVYAQRSRSVSKIMKRSGRRWKVY